LEKMKREAKGLDPQDESHDVAKKGDLSLKKS
jgi:hypothetical protein